MVTSTRQAKASVNREIMFATQYLAPNSVHRLRPGAGGLDIELGWFALMQPYKNFVDDYEMKDGKRPEESVHYDADNSYQNRDPRLYATVKLPSQEWVNPVTGEMGELYNSYTGFHTKKWVDLRRLPFVNETARQSDQDYIHLRYADILLPTLKNPSGVSYVFSEHNYRLPFSITELDNNPQLTQNDGYN